MIENQHLRDNLEKLEEFRLQEKAKNYRIKELNKVVNEEHLKKIKETLD